jgi:hypothetical protein
MSDNIEPGIGSRVEHQEFGKGVIINIKPRTYMITFMERGVVEVAKHNSSLTITDAVEPQPGMVSLQDVERTLLNIIQRHSDLQRTVKLGQRWEGGSMILKPANEDLKSKEIPVETFFHKITMLRDRLRVMEQRINSSESLTEEEKINLQQYITRIYGSLTTFNVLFAEKEDHFVGEKK